MSESKKPTASLFAGLTLIGLSFVCKAMGWNTVFYVLLVIGIILKSRFLVQSIRQGRIKAGPALYMLFAGVILVITSVILRHNDILLRLSASLLIAGIVLKCMFVVLMIVKKIKYKSVSHLK